MVDDGNRGRCKECASAAVRITRMKLDCESAPMSDVQWDSLEEKQGFFAKAKTLFGDGLKMLLEETFSHKLDHVDEISITGTRDLFDEPDMTEKYKSKPQRLAAILKNAKRFKCPISETILFEDMSYTSTAKQTSLHTSSSKRELTGENKIKAAPVAKKAKVEKVKVEGQEGDDDKDLTEKQIAQITKLIESAQKVLKLVSDPYEQMTHEDAAPWREFMPAYVETKCAAAKMMVEQQVQMLELNKESQKGKFAKMTADWKAACAMCKESGSIAKLQIDCARRMVV